MKIGVFIDNDNFFNLSKKYGFNGYDLDLIKELIKFNYVDSEIEGVFFVSSSQYSFSANYLIHSEFYKNNLVECVKHSPLRHGRKESDGKIIPEKPASDFLNYIYALKDLYKFNQFDVFIFVSNDMDMYPLIEEILKNKREVMVILYSGNCSNGFSINYLKELQEKNVKLGDYYTALEAKNKKII
jgi:rhodanese-related sulfurtransferase